jgi:hypothetical protein
MRETRQDGERLHSLARQGFKSASLPRNLFRLEMLQADKV